MEYRPLAKNPALASAPLLAEPRFRQHAPVARIEKDGRVSEFTLVRPSGNVLVDESVKAVGQRLTRVDALPASLARSGHFDVNINFELNAQN